MTPPDVPLADDPVEAGRRLRDLLAQLRTCAPMERINLRDPILSYGEACIEPLLAVLVNRPDLGASAAAWLGVLAIREPSTAPVIRKALRRLAGNDDGGIAQQGVRLKLAVRPEKGVVAADHDYALDKRYVYCTVHPDVHVVGRT